MHIEYTDCRLCARRCGVDRESGVNGYCRSGAEMHISRADLHHWEEPIISGTNGSGTVFFSGCSLGCIYCQNREISRGSVGRKISETELSEIMLDLQSKGAHNINFVTPTHYAPGVIAATKIARERGLLLPIVYNTGSYDTVDTIKKLRGTVDVYLPDYKYFRRKTAAALSGSADYPDVAFDAIREMVSQQPVPVISDGIMKKGVIIRILLLPGHLAEAKLSVSRLYKAFGNSVYFSLMGQYTVMPEMPHPLDRRVTVSEYSELVSYAEKQGVINGFVQELSSSATEYIPEFDIKSTTLN